jgi:hypothetical protein
LQKNQNHVICRKIDGTEDHHVSKVRLRETSMGGGKKDMKVEEVLLRKMNGIRRRERE